MKQRVRAKRIKARTYGQHIYAARVRRAWEQANQAYRTMGEAMREAWARGRQEVQA